MEDSKNDIYSRLMSFINAYASQVCNPLENSKSRYIVIVYMMEQWLKDLTDYLKTIDKIYIPLLKRDIKLDHLTLEEQLALEDIFKQQLISNLNNYLNNESKTINTK